MKNKKINLITGGSGFVGSNLVRLLLSKGDDVHIIIHSTSDLWRLKDIIHNIHIHEAEIFDENKVRSIVKDIQPTNVFHLAHYGGNSGQNDDYLIRKVIIEGTASLYKACIGIPSIDSIVYAGSSSEYGYKNEPMRESMLPEPNTEYGVAKLWATNYSQYLVKKNNLPIKIARLFSVYGPYEHRNRFITEVVLSCLNNIDPKLTNKNTARDFVFVDDVVFALSKISENGENGDIYNVGSGKESKLFEAANMIKKYTGFDRELNWGSMENRSFDTSHWLADISHIQKELNWTPENTLEDGIRKTVEWFKNNSSKYKND